MTHCCQSMAHFADAVCPNHSDPFDCPDHIISYSSKYDCYGIIIHDGGGAVITIGYCPWCGSNIEKVKQ
jgi:hypothetical protein